MNDRLELRFSGRTVNLEPGQSVKIGRDPTADLVVEHELVSRRHASIDYRDGWHLADQNSTNGIYHNGSLVETVGLSGRSEVRLGDPVTGPLIEVTVHPAAIEPMTIVDATSVDEATRMKGSSAQPYRSIPKTLIEPTAGQTLITVGTAPDNTIVLRDLFVSRKHARLVGSNDGFLVEDINSLNGTYLNGQLISSGFMQDGDILSIGHHDFTRQRGALVPAKAARKGAGGLSVRSLGYAISNGKKLLHDIDLTASRGTLTAVIGPSGAGKSTLSRVLTGGTLPSQGAVRFDEFDVHGNYDLVRTRIGLVPQEDVLHRQLKLNDALGFAAKLRLPASASPEIRGQEVKRVIDQLGLSAHTGTRIDKLSGGQRKRASVALELLTEPSLLVLDEPTSGLDPALDRQVMRTLRELADGDRAVIVITHSVAYLDVCDQVLVLAPGGVPAFLGPVEAIPHHFGTSDWAEIFARIAADPKAAHDLFRSRNAPLPPPVVTFAAAVSAGVTTPWWRQFWTLAARQVSVVFSDAGYLIFLALLPVVLGLLALVVPGSQGFGTPKLEFPGEPSQLLALLIVGACFMGSSMSIRDLVGERPIFFRERAVGLSPSAYLLSKVLVFGVFSWISAAVLTLIVLIGKPHPIYSLVFPSGSFDLFIAIGVTTSCSAVLGLLVSSLVRSSEQAMPLLVVVLMAQLVLHGGLIPVTGRAVLDQLSWFVPARWGFAAAASSTNIQSLIPSLDQDPIWAHAGRVWVFDLALLTVFALAFGAATLFKLRARAR